MKAGLSKVDITCFEPGMVMMGWGQLGNRAYGVDTPLYARALVLHAGARKVAIVSVEVLFVSIAVREAVLEQLAADGFGPHSVMIGATHTHSGPSGFTHYLGYNATNFGYSPLVLQTIVDGVVRAVREADARAEPARARVASVEVPLDEPVAFNRSVDAYNANRDCAPVDRRFPERATHREATTLRVDADDGTPLGAVHWFGVHCSSLHANNHRIHGDNKGLAAATVERALSERGARAPVALMLQEAAGDVSPNWRLDPRRGLHVGAKDADRDSAAHNAAIQARYALRAWEAARASRPLRGELRCAVEHLDFGCAFAGARRTRPPVMGLGMAAGTDEGPGPLRPLATVLRAVSRLRPRDPKLPWLSTDRGARGRFLGLIPTRIGLRLVGPVEPRIAFVKAADDAGAVGDAPWLPRVLPLQLLWLGDLLLAGVPFEPTTVAGRRVRAALAGFGGRVVVTGYANAYGGYVTTPEEYRCQSYEGAATYFGEHTLAALTNALTWLARTGGAAPEEPVFGPRLERLDRARLDAQRRVGQTMRGEASR